MNLAIATVLSDLSRFYRAAEVNDTYHTRRIVAGAGKSSLLDVLAGRAQPSSGSILVNGKPRTSGFLSLAAYVAQASKQLALSHSKAFSQLNTLVHTPALSTLAHRKACNLHVTCLHTRVNHILEPH